jgi:hypothetical protein
VHVVEVDVVDAEALERGVTGGPDVVRGVVDRADAVDAPDAELGGQHHLVAAVLDGPADELLVVPAAVHVGGVEEVDAEVEGAVDDRDGLLLVALAVELGHAHAAEPESRHLRPVLAQSALVHFSSPPVTSLGAGVRSMSRPYRP